MREREIARLPTTASIAVDASIGTGNREPIA
jgi:hypothetical protein